MQVFDPEAWRRVLDDPDTGYRWSLAHDYEKSAANSVSGHVADANIGEAISCLLVGYDGPGEQLLVHARHWLRLAIANEERSHAYAQYATEAERYLNLATCNWLLEDRNDLESVQAYLTCRRHLSSIHGPSKYISFVLPNYVDAGAFREALALFEASPLKPAPSLSRIVSEGQMCYVLCRHLLGEAYSAPEVAAALRRFLDRAINHWLLDGHWATAAKWMKIVHWNGHEHELTARQALLKCYDYLKDPIPIGPDNIP